MIHARTQHPNAPLTPEGRRRMVACVLEQNWTIEATGLDPGLAGDGTGLHPLLVEGAAGGQRLDRVLEARVGASGPERQRGRCRRVGRVGVTVTIGPAGMVDEGREPKDIDVDPGRVEGVAPCGRRTRTRASSSPSERRSFMTCTRSEVS
jgi:hypothetical protein